MNSMSIFSHASKHPFVWQCFCRLVRAKWNLPNHPELWGRGLNALHYTRSK